MKKPPPRKKKVGKKRAANKQRKQPPKTTNRWAAGEVLKGKDGKPRIIISRDIVESKKPPRLFGRFKDR